MALERVPVLVFDRTNRAHELVFITDAEELLMLYYEIADEGRRTFTRKDIACHHNPRAKEIEDGCNGQHAQKRRRFLKEFERLGYITCEKKGLFHNTFTAKGIEHVKCLKQRMCMAMC